MSKKNRKRRSMIAVILLIAFLITGCEDKSVKTDHIIRIGVVTYTQDDPFINAMTDQLKENLKKMETDHMKIITTVKNGDDNQQDQNEIVEEMIDAGCDVLCVNLVDRTAPSRIIRMAKQEDIPVLFFNREPVREDLMQWEKLYYIGCNAEQSGIMQGEIVADYIKNHPEVDKNQDEIKKPLSLMTLLLDNRKDEMSPLVHTRMLYVRGHTRQDIEQILYFSRLGATHKDYFFEPLSILEICREAVEDNLTLLEEAGFSVEYTENDAQVISDKKGLMFILGQIISNSVKYTGNNPAPRLLFSIADSADNEQISLSMKDNGTSIPLSDLPFVFDKGFTGDTGSYLSRSTGMGLYLVQKMATDLSITVELKNNSCGGTTVTLTFPKVERPFGR